MTDDQKRQAIKDQIDAMISSMPNGEIGGFHSELVNYMNLFSNYDEPNKLWTTDDGTKTVSIRIK